MRYLMLLRNIFRRHGLIAMTAIVFLAGPTRADRFPPDPVEELHQFLQLAPDDLRNRYPEVGKRLGTVKPEDYQAAFEKERDRLLAERIKAVRTIPEMRRALLLQEWRLDQVGEAFGEVEKMNRKYRNELAERFQEAVRKVLLEGNLDSKLAALNMLAELGVSIRTLKEPNGIGRAFEKDVADLSKRGQTATLRETAARTLGQIFPDPEVAEIGRASCRERV